MEKTVFEMYISFEHLLGEGGKTVSLLLISFMGLVKHHFLLNLFAL